MTVTTRSRPQPAMAARPRTAPAPRTRTSGARTAAAPRPAARTPHPTRRTQPTRRPHPARRPRLLRLAATGRRLHLALLAAAVVFSLLAGRLVELQAVQAPEFAARAEAGRLRTVDLPAGRGAITDVHGRVLASSVEARDITADPTLVVDPAGTAGALARLLGLDLAGRRALEGRLTGERRFAYVARQVTPQAWAQVERLRLPGILSQPTSRRVYPAGGLAAGVVGFVGLDGEGLGGMELGLQRELAGRDGSLTYESGPGGRQISTAASAELDPVHGVDVRLTIDRDIQWQAQQLIAQRVKDANADSGSVVVLDPRTGAVLALATAPTFDPADPGASPVADRGNRALSDIYEPGSTSKIMTAAAVLEEGALRPDSPVTVPPTLRFGDKVFHDHNKHPTLHLTFTGVLAKSSNIGTILAAQKIGDQKLYAYLQKFGLGQKTGLGFPGESKGLLPTPDTWSRAQFGTIAFGQGLSLNAVQAASVFATIANDGVRVQPSLVAATVAPDGVVAPAAPPQQTRVVSAATARTLRAMLETVVSDEGTAPMARVPGYRVAGKTGTANRVDPACSCYRGYTASFIGFAPADAPRLVVAVTLQNPRNGHYGGRLAGPVFRDVMGFALQTLKVPPTTTAPPRLRLTMD